MAAVDPTNPQSWNRYAYVMNNPLNFIDFVGLECYASDQFGNCTNWGSSDGSNLALLGGFADPFSGMDIGFAGPGDPSPCYLCLLRGQSVFMSQILDGDNTFSWPLGPGPLEILRQVLSGNFSALGVPTLGQLTGPIMDAQPGNAANNGQQQPQPPKSPQPNPPQDPNRFFSEKTCVYLDWGTAYPGVVALPQTWEPLGWGLGVAGIVTWVCLRWGDVDGIFSTMN